MATKPLNTVYRPTHDEAARQGFVTALKGFLNGPLEASLAEHYEHELEPAFVEKHGHKPRDRHEGTDAFAGDHLYQLWGSAVYASQDLMWDSLNETCSRLLPEFEARRLALAAGSTLGTLELDDTLAIPDPIREVEIHRQPGGYFGRPGDDTLRQGMDYLGTGEMYMAAKGFAEQGQAGKPGMGRFLLSALRRRFPEFQPAAILDVGCGAGIQTVAYKQAFPEADVSGVDLSQPFLKFAHVWAEDQGLAIHYRQADARDTGFADESFDLVISHILFHETWHDVLPGIMQEAHRLLKPGGIFFNGDTPFQPARLSMQQQVTNHWQVVNNGEPFWTGYADTDMREALIDAGFSQDQVFADYEPLGAGERFIFGGVKASS